MEDPSDTAGVPVWPAHMRTDWRLAMEWLEQDMDELERLLPSCGVSAAGGCTLMNFELHPATAAQVRQG
jgi:hypothetical protein